MQNDISRRQALALSATLTAGALLNLDIMAAAAPKRRVVVWSERTAPKEVYPNDINGAIADALKDLKGWEVVTASIDDPDQGVSEASLQQTDVLIWWGHKRHGEVKNELVDRIVKRVKEEGMGFLSVHSSHFAKPYKKLMGTACSWGEYKVDGSSAKIIVKDAKHPIAKGVKDFELAKVERYAEPFAVPTPEAVVFEGVIKMPGGQEQTARMGMTWTVGQGKVFYFQPGHETYEELMHPEVKKLFCNAVEWAAPKR